MAWTITQLKLLMDDPTPTLLSDNDYTAILAIESNLYRAALLACQKLASRYAQKMKISAGSISIDMQQKFEHYLSLGEFYRGLADSGYGEYGGVNALYTEPKVGGVSISDMDTVDEDTDRVKPSATRGMHDYVTG